MSGVGVQDFAPVVIGRRANKGSGGSGTAAEGGNKKQAGVVGIGGKLESGAARKLDDNETKAPDTVGREVGKAIMAAREAKEWNQKALADNLNIAKAVIVQLEQGIHKKDNPLLQRLEKKLGVWLTGDNERIGQPKAEKEKKKVAASTAKSAMKKAPEADRKKAVERTDENDEPVAGGVGEGRADVQAGEEEEETGAPAVQNK